MVLSEEIRRKLSAAAKRRWAEGRGPVHPPLSADIRRKYSEAARRQWREGKGTPPPPTTPETKLKIAASLRNNPRVKANCEWMHKFRIAKVRARKIRFSPIFNELEVVDLVLRYQRSGGGDEAIFARIISASLLLIDSTIRRYSPQSSSSDFTETRHDLILKLAALLLKYDVRRGKAFTFFTLCLKNTLINHFHGVVRRRSRFQLTDNEELLEALGERASAPEEKLESEEFLERLRELLRPDPAGWQWRFRWHLKGRLPVAGWRAGWRWKRLGTMTA
jgi:hypothetical protein